MPSMLDEKFMAHTLRLSRKYWGLSSPNPAVGALVVKNGRIVGQGVHQKTGQAHGEVLALQEAGAQTKGATLYVNLEPCNHHGCTPPCASAILAAGIKRVVYGLADPNPVACGGAAFLASQGVRVSGGVLEAACAHEHRMFLTHKLFHRPYVILKTATSLDGRIATATGESQWITGAKARAKTHWLRARMQAIMVGRGTLMADDPSLTCRLPGYQGRQPLKVVVDSKLSVPLKAKVLHNPENTVIACGPKASRAREEALLKAGVRVWRLALDVGGQLDLAQLLTLLGSENIGSLMLEGGGELAFSMARAGLVDELWQFVAPMLIGGKNAPGFVGGQGFASLSQAPKFTRPQLTRLDDDILLVCTRKKDD